MNPNDPIRGSQIGRYVIERHIATGGMANVYLARDTELERKVALKIMLPELADDEQFVQRFRREGQAVAKLNHPSIVKVYDIGFTDDGHPYIAMQYIDGTSLRDTLQQLDAQGKLLPTIQALWIMRQLTDALQYAHSAGVIHRDLKPSNVLIESDGTPVLVDLGIAVVQGSNKLTATGNIIGTPHYMSPEQVQGRALDGRSDIYSLGVILYELLSGHVPFDAPDSISVLHKHVYEAAPTLALERAGLARETYDVVHTSLKKLPEERYQNAGQLILALDAAIAAESAGSWVTQTGSMRVPPMGTLLVDRTQMDMPPPTAETEPAPSTIRKYWWAPLLLLLLLIPLCGFAAFTVYSQSQTSAEIEATTLALATALTAQADPASDSRVSFGSGDMAEEETPTATAEVPTATPTPMPTDTPTPLPTEPPAPTITPIPLPTEPPPPTACSVQVHGPFQTAWSGSQASLGCAVSGASGGVWTAQESFEGGRMFWRSDNDKIYAVYNSGVWANYDDIWVEGEPDYTCGPEQSPPTPRRGFGKIWCTYSNVRNGLGNATSGESGVNATIQSFANGFIMQPDGGRAYVFSYDGTWR